MRSNLPLHLTRFIGRRREISEIKQQLTQSRLLTITGPGGCGKTRLAAVVTAQVQNEYEDGCSWVDLATVSEETLVAQTIAKAIDSKEQPGRSIKEMLTDSLQGKRLLVLDNCEHLIAVCAQLVNDFLRACPDLTILLTSREHIAIAGEWVFPVPALSIPTYDVFAEGASSAGNSFKAYQALYQYEAVQLFVDRAVAIVPGFTLERDNARAIVDICNRLDGMPLAIELAAARVNVLTASQIASHLDNRFALLKSGQRAGVDLRHQTLQAAISWSYDSLGKPEQLLLQRLSVFAGGCSLNTVEMVCTYTKEEQKHLLSTISSLVNKSLVVADTVRSNSARYSLLETIRQYGQEKLKKSGEWSSIHNRHLYCFLQLTEETEPKLTGEYQQLWLNWLENERANIQTALAWSLQNGQVEAGLRIAIAIYPFWTIRDHVEEGLNWFDRLIAKAGEELRIDVLANAVFYAMTMAGFRRNREAQFKYGDLVADLMERIDAEDKEALRWVLSAFALRARLAGDHYRAFGFAKQTIQIARELEDTYQLSMNLSLWSIAAMSLGELGEARTMLDEAIPLLREMKNSYRTAMALNFSGDLSRCEQNYLQARTNYEESISLLQEIHANRDLASVYHNLGHACLHLDDLEKATALFQDSMILHQEQGNEAGMTECLLGFAALAIVSELPGAGARLLATAANIGGGKITGEWASTSMTYEYYLDLAQTNLSAPVFQKEQAAGKRLSLNEAVALAEEVVMRTTSSRQTHEKLDQLTPREREVAIMIAKGKTNEEIADGLVLSKRTVEKHIAHIRSKLGVTERTKIVRWVIESGPSDLRS